MNEYRTHPYPKKESTMKIDFEKLLNLFCKALVVFSAFGIVSYVSFCLYKNLTTPRIVDFCYLERDYGNVILYASIPWHKDDTIDWFGSTEAAKKAADLLGCPLNIPKLKIKDIEK